MNPQVRLTRRCKRVYAHHRQRAQKQGEALGYSATGRPGCYEGLELQTDVWRMTPLHVDRANSSFFDDPQRFPAGAAALDSAFLMRDIPHQWRDRGRLVFALTPSAEN